MEKNLTTNSKEETCNLAAAILNDLEGLNIILLEGELGAGKTTFTQGLLTAAGAEGPFTSPTFVIMKKYDLKILNLKSKILNPKFQTIYHLDCYRVGSRDVLDLGWQEIINNPGNLVIVEWPEKIQDIWPKNYLKIEFEIAGEKERKIKITKY